MRWLGKLFANRGCQQRGEFRLLVVGNEHISIWVATADHAHQVNARGGRTNDGARFRAI